MVVWDPIPLNDVKLDDFSIGSLGVDLTNLTVFRSSLILILHQLYISTIIINNATLRTRFGGLTNPFNPDIWGLEPPPRARKFKPAFFCGIDEENGTRTTGQQRTEVIRETICMKRFMTGYLWITTLRH
jgi:hypothetical protein